MFILVVMQIYKYDKGSTFSQQDECSTRVYLTPFSTANIKALRESLGALSVNKLSHIPKLQPISAVYENQ